MQQTDSSDQQQDSSLLHLVTQRSRANLIQDLIGHPKESPSLIELDYMNVDQTQSTIQGHLDRLIEHGLVEKVTADNTAPALPSKFYTLSEEGRTLLERYNLFVGDEQQLKDDYAAVEKPERVKRHETAPRPWEDDDDPVEIENGGEMTNRRETRSSAGFGAGTPLSARKR